MCKNKGLVSPNETAGAPETQEAAEEVVAVQPVAAPEITPAMIEAGAKELEHQLWLLDPFAKPFNVGVLKLVIPEVYRVMAALVEPS